MGRRARRRAREAAPREQEPKVPIHRLPEGQQMARVNLAPDQWAYFRSSAQAQGRSVADYLGHLVRNEIRRLHRREAAQGSGPLALPQYRPPPDETHVPVVPGGDTATER